MAAEAAMLLVQDAIGAENVVMATQEEVSKVINAERMGFANNKQKFDNTQRLAVENKGLVLPGIAKAEVDVVHAEVYDFDGMMPSDWAMKNLVTEHVEGKGIVYDNILPTTADGTTYSISKKAVDKFVSDSATHKYEGYDTNAHIRVLPYVKEIISNSIDAEIHPNYNKKGKKRQPENGFAHDSIVHRMYGAVIIDGKLYRVKTTMIEYKGSVQINRPHTFEVQKIELIDESTNSGARQTTLEENSLFRIDGTKLLKGVEKSYDIGKKLLEESEKMSSKELMYQQSVGTRAEFMQVWHGSGTVFDHFDGAFMGTGEMYATIAAENRQRSQTPIVFWKGEQIDFSDANPLRMAYDLANDSRTIAEARQRAERYADMAEEQDMKDKWRSALGYLKQSTKANFKPAPVRGNRKLYSVEIPDDNGSNYLDWNKKLGARIIQKVYKALTDAKKDIIKSQDTGYYQPVSEIDRFNWRLANESTTGKYLCADIVYELQDLFGKKEASNILNRAGFTGVKVPTGNNRGGDGRGMNYVIFNDADRCIREKHLSKRATAKSSSGRSRAIITSRGRGL